MTAADLISAISELPRDQLPALLAAIAARLAEPPLAGPPPDTANGADDESLDIEQAAARLHRSTKWIYRHRESLPFVRRLGPRSYVVSKAKLENWLARR